MPLCPPTLFRASSPLEARAAAQPELPLQEAQYPMFVMPMERLLTMETVEPHQALRSRGMLVEYSPELGPAIFVSHQHASPSRHNSPLSMDRARVLHCNFGFL